MVTRLRTQAFTVVELIIVIVVIGILATITLVSYRSVQNRAYETRMQSDLQQAASEIEVTAQRSGGFPGQGIVASLPKSDDESSYQYTTLGNGYCLTLSSTRENISAYHVNEEGRVAKGSCFMHGQPASTSCFGASYGVINSYNSTTSGCPGSDGGTDGSDRVLIVPSVGYSIATGVFNGYTDPGKRFGTIVLPSTMQTIGQAAFAYTIVKNLYLPEGLTTIGVSAFYYNQLTSVVIPESVTSIGTDAFYSSANTVCYIKTGKSYGSNTGCDSFAYY